MKQKTGLKKWPIGRAPEYFSQPSSNSQSSVTLAFSGLVPGKSVDSYSESGFILSSKGSDIYAINGCQPPGAIGAIPSSSGSALFTLQHTNGSPFRLYTMMLANLKRNAGPQTLKFVGILAKGGIVRYTLKTNGLSLCNNNGPGHCWQTFEFPPDFTNLLVIVWAPQISVVTNILLGPVYPPSELRAIKSNSDPVSSAYNFSNKGLRVKYGDAKAPPSRRKAATSRV